MKVSIGSRIVKGPWGGGNLFVKNLSKYLKNLGHDVLYDLSDPDIDLILLTDPRSRKESSSTFTHNEIILYKKYINPKVSVVQRINECDERKNTDNINQFYLVASECADKVVFVSKWLEKIYLELGMEPSKSSVIMSGSDTDIFKNYDNKENESNLTKIVTHHWSSHKNKGFEGYLQLDSLINSEKWKNKISFSYIGNISKEFNFDNTEIIDPLSGIELAQKLSENDIYFTASINEPSGNHHIEAALCGLPVLYLNSGGIPEYCKGFGVSINSIDELEDKLEEIIEQKEFYKEKLRDFPFNSENMNKEYLKLFELLVKNKDDKYIKVNPTIKYFYLIRFMIIKFTRKFSRVNLTFMLKEILKK